MSVGMENAMEDGYSPLGGLKTVPCDRWSEDSRVGSGFVCHAQQTGSSCADRGRTNSKGVSNVEGYSIPDVWSMNRWRCRRAPEMCSDAAGLDAAAA